MNFTQGLLRALAVTAMICPVCHMNENSSIVIGIISFNLLITRCLREEENIAVRNETKLVTEWDQ